MLSKRLTACHSYRGLDSSSQLGIGENQLRLVMNPDAYAN